MYSAKVLDHFWHPRNRGGMEGATVAIEATNPVCGDLLKLWVVVEEGRVAEVKFECEGCIPAVACASLLTEMMQGSSVAALACITAQALESALDGLPPASRHASALAITGLEQAVETLRRQS